MKKNSLITFVLLFLLLLPGPLPAKEPQRTITVTGSASTTVQPDHALLHAHLKLISPSAEESYNKVTSELSALTERLSEYGLSKEHIVISAITQGPEYSWQNNTRILKGYFAAGSITLKINQLDEIYKIHQQLSRFTSISIGGTEYGRNDEAEITTVTLQKALLNAAKKAQVMADTLNVSLGKVLIITENSTGAPPMPMRTARLAESADLAQSTTTGALTIHGNVTVQFALE